MHALKAYVRMEVHLQSLLTWVLDGCSGVPRIFFREVQQIQSKTEGRENGVLGTVAP